MYNFVKGKQIEIIDKYHCRLLGKHIQFFDVFNHLNDYEQYIIVANNPGILKIDYCYEQILFKYYHYIRFINKIYTKSENIKKSCYF